MERILDANYPLRRDGCCDSFVRLYDRIIQAGNKKGEINMKNKHIPTAENREKSKTKTTTFDSLYHVAEWV